MDTVPAWKKEEVARLTKLMKYSPVVAVVDIENIPSFQMQQMRARLRGSVNLIVSRNTLIERALDDVSSDREGILNLKEHLGGQTALVTTDLNPFKLFKRMESTKTSAPARGGDIAPENIKVEKGDTPFKPGPIVGDLQKAGIPASIQSGKVRINKTKVVAKAGESISSDLAKMLTRLDINPITVGLDLKIAYEDGTLFDKETLDIDTDKYFEDLKMASQSAFNLSVNAAYPTSLNTESIIMKAHRDAFSLAFNTDIMVDETVKLKISQAHKDMLSIVAKLDPEILGSELMEKLGLEQTNEKTEG